ncbi:MAG: segregation/condensation protein A [Deltaproteobacteria bacterium]|nr:segregation/condensation protein A [Deltaproteobacteria bacterium]
MKNASTKGEILFEENQTYKVRLEGFEGPLDLLLHLIRKHRYDVYDIPIAQILREYLAVLDAMQELDIDVAGDFVLMAATLAHIKSRMLLPVPEEEAAEEGEDPRSELVRRLVEYEQFRQAAGDLESLAILGRDVFARTWRAPELDEAAAGAEVPMEGDLYDLLLAFHELLREAPEEFVEDVARQRVSIQEAIEEILDRFEGLAPGSGVSFRELFPARPTRDRIVATFLALLELIRLRAVRVQQAAAFGEIWIQSIPAAEV